MVIHKQSQYSLGLRERPKEITFRHITGEHDYRNKSFLTILDYIFMLVGLILQALFLASDVYTLIQIYALNSWDEFHIITYIPVLAYKIVFTTCIGFSFLFVIWTWMSGLMTYKKDLIVKSYLNNGARKIDSLRNYERFCIYNEISTKNFLDWMALTIYQTFHYEIVNWLLADTPRQALNGATIAYSVSNHFTSGNIISVIKNIAQEDREEAVLLSFMFFSFLIWLVFTLRNVILLLSSICVTNSIKRREKTSLSKYIHKILAQSVVDLYDKMNTEQQETFEKRRKVPSMVADPIFMKPIALDRDGDSFIGSSFLDEKESSTEWTGSKDTTDIELGNLSASDLQSNSRDIYLNGNDSSAFSRTQLISHKSENPFIGAHILPSERPITRQAFRKDTQDTYQSQLSYANIYEPTHNKFSMNSEITPTVNTIIDSYAENMNPFNEPVKDTDTQSYHTIQSRKDLQQDTLVPLPMANPFDIMNTPMSHQSFPDEGNNSESHSFSDDQPLDDSYLDLIPQPQIAHTASENTLYTGRGLGDFDNRTKL
ncbi:Kch1 protein [Martiniozyma asiatica (nom. inval.)]|nr:Kch1 protein [Martiniozyma asiatica]